MGKDFVGLNNCVRDIFQGDGDCGHPNEIHGSSDLNTLGFTGSNIDGRSTWYVTADTILAAKDGALFTITASKGSLVTEVTFEITSGSLTNGDIKIDTTGMTAFAPTASDWAQKAELANRIDASLKETFNFTPAHPSSPVQWGDQAVFLYWSNVDSLSATPSGSNWSTPSPTFTITEYSGSAYYNDLPNGGVRSEGVLHALNIHRNGPYGWPTWKQVRAGENRINQYLRKNNKLTIVKPEDSILVTHLGGAEERVPRKNAQILCYDEPAVTSKHHPLQFGVGKKVMRSGRKSMLRKFGIESSYNNNITFFSNEGLNYYLQAPELEDENFHVITDMYLNGALSKECSPLDYFEFLKFKQTVFPKEIYTYKGQNRYRVNYSNNYWRFLREHRRLGKAVDNGGTVGTFYLTSAFGSGNYYQESKWPLDSRNDFITQDGALWASMTKYFGFVGIDAEPVGTWWSGSQGILQNPYSQFVPDLESALSNPPDDETSGQSLNKLIAPGPLLSRRQTLVVRNISGDTSDAGTWFESDYQDSYPKSFINPSGMTKLRSNETILLDDDPQGPPECETRDLTRAAIFGGETNWDAPVHAGREPFYDTVAKFAEKMKNKYKDYSILPEFKISDHISFYSKNGVTIENSNLFEILGGKTAASNSSGETFYKIYSTTDFFKNFDLIETEHKNFAEPSSIRLTCKAVKKFIPYDSFYPAQRCVDLSKQFYDSYSDNFIIVRSPNSSTLQPIGSGKFNHAAQNILTPLFAPGILFNTIKSGIACDYPVYSECQTPYRMSDAAANETDVLEGRPPQKDGSITQFTQDRSPSCFDGFYVNDYSSSWAWRDKDFDFRVPFEAIVSPEDHLTQRPIICMEPHPSGNIKTVVMWNGQGDNFYKKMANNFMAEVPEFFLKDQSFSSIVSLPQGHPEFGNAISGSYYTMRIRMSRAMSGSNKFVSSRDWPNCYYTPPQDIASDYYRESITMNSRPSSFGPPSFGVSGYSQTTASYPWESTKYDGNAAIKLASEQLSSVLANIGEHTSSYVRTHNKIWKGSECGYNFPYTPPYYHGEAWADIIFECTESKKMTLNQIFSLASVRMYEPGWENKNGVHYSRFAPQPYLGRWTENHGWQDTTEFFPDYDSSHFQPGNWLYAYGITLGTDSYAKGNWDPGDCGSGLQSLPSLFDGNVFNADVDPSKLPPGTSSFKLAEGPQTMENNRINKNAMQLDSCFNLFGKGMLERVDLEDDNTTGTNVKVVVDSFEEDKSRWVIQSKFETPVLNFNKYDTYVQTSKTTNDITSRYTKWGNETYRTEWDSAVTIPFDKTGLTNSPEMRAASWIPSSQATMVTRGMWHQLGEIPDENTGISLQITDIPRTWLFGALSNANTSVEEINSTDALSGSASINGKTIRSLKDLVGFKSDPVRIGQIAEAREIREAVVAVPFIDEASGRKFFSLPRKDITNARIGITKNKTGKTIVDMVEKMSRYVFPPSMDFLTYDFIDPFAMYIFEFKHVLSKQDLSYIWQNLSPDIGLQHEEAEASISHELLSHELLGEGAKMSVTEDGSKLDESSKNTKFDSKIRWMVFKVKQKAQTDYYSKVLSKEKTNLLQEAGNNNKANKLGKDDKFTYNWPYDFFSLVELVKIDAEVEFSNVGRDEDTQARRVKPVLSDNPVVDVVDMTNPLNALRKPD